MDSIHKGQDDHREPTPAAAGFDYNLRPDYSKHPSWARTTTMTPHTQSSSTAPWSEDPLYVWCGVGRVGGRAVHEAWASRMDVFFQAAAKSRWTLFGIHG